MTRAFVVVFASCLLNVPLIGAQEVHHVKENGITYRQTTTTEVRPVTETEYLQSQQTVYKQQYVTAMQDSFRTVYSPVTQYVTEPRWHNWWNPFGRPYVAYHVKPRTHWETRYEKYQLPVTYQEWVPETRTVVTPTRTTKLVEEEVTRKVAITPRSTQVLARRPFDPSVRTATRPPIPYRVGVERYDAPPRQQQY